jgi:hypothetical protein
MNKDSYMSSSFGIRDTQVFTFGLGFCSRLGVTSAVWACPGRGCGAGGAFERLFGALRAA